MTTKCYETKYDSDSDIAIIYIHGITSNMNTCLYLKQYAVDHNLNYYSFDLPLHGNNELELEVDFNYMCEYALNKIKVQNFKKIILVGHSMGGAITIVLKQALENVIGLILINPLNPSIKFLNHESVNFSSLLESGSNIKNYLISKKNTLMNVDLMKLLISCVSNNTLAELDLAFNSNQTETLVVLGEDDKIVNYLKTYKYFQSLSKHYKVHTIVHAGHSPFNDKPDEFNKIVTTYFNLLAFGK